MKYWNDLDGSVFFNMVFSQPVEIGEIVLFSMRIDNNRPSVTLGFDISALPDRPPKKWQTAKYNTCRIGISCSDISELIVKNIPTRDVLKMTIEKQNNTFYIRATSESSSIEFKSVFPRLCDPSVYLNDPDSACY